MGKQQRYCCVSVCVCVSNGVFSSKPRISEKTWGNTHLAAAYYMWLKTYFIQRFSLNTLENLNLPMFIPCLSHVYPMFISCLSRGTSAMSASHRIKKGPSEAQDVLRSSRAADLFQKLPFASALTERSSGPEAGPGPWGFRPRIPMGCF